MFDDVRRYLSDTIDAVATKRYDDLQQIAEFATAAKAMRISRIVRTLNYGGRDELVHAVKKIVAEGVPADEITEQTISDRLYTAGMPDPDFIIRPSGEYRTSNYLLWQSAYAEYWISDVLWPDFTQKHLEQAIDDYNRRSRRFGGV